MIWCVEAIGESESKKYRVLYNYGERKREFIGEDSLPKTVKKFIGSSSYTTASMNGVSWRTYYK